MKGNKHILKRSVNYFLSTLFSKVLLFETWAFFYLYRSNLSYLTDYDGSLIVKYIGQTESINQDFHNIMESLDIDVKHIQVGKSNTSSHKSEDYYFKSEWFKKRMYQKMKLDINLYNRVCIKLKN
jgi:hypothetical protein